MAMQQNNIKNALSTLTDDFEQLNMAYEEYAVLLAECSDISFDQGMLINILNGKMNELINNMRSFL